MSIIHVQKKQNNPLYIVPGDTSKCIILHVSGMRTYNIICNLSVQSSSVYYVEIILCFFFSYIDK